MNAHQVIARAQIAIQAGERAARIFGVFCPVKNLFCACIIARKKQFIAPCDFVHTRIHRQTSTLIFTVSRDPLRGFGS